MHQIRGSVFRMDLVPYHAGIKDKINDIKRAPAG